MPPKIFIPVFGLLTLILILTSPPLLRTFIPEPLVTPTATPAPATPTPTPIPTTDPFAFVPTATPLGIGRDGVAVGNGDTGTILPGIQVIERVVDAPSTPHPFSGQPLFTLTATPALTTAPAATVSPVSTATLVTILPDTVTAASRPLTTTEALIIPAAPQPVSVPPSQLTISKLKLDVPVEAVGLVPSTVAPGVLEWGVPAYRAAGWLNTSAPLGQLGNTVLDGHHNVHGEVFRDLWTLQTGDGITLTGDGQTRQYRVSEVLILPERDQPLAVRLQNARYIQPTEDERLTLVTCWPYEDNSHRTVVIAFPVE